MDPGLRLVHGLAGGHQEGKDRKGQVAPGLVQLEFEGVDQLDYGGEARLFPGGLEKVAVQFLHLGAESLDRLFQHREAFVVVEGLDDKLTGQLMGAEPRLDRPSGEGLRVVRIEAKAHGDRRLDTR